MPLFGKHRGRPGPPRALLATLLILAVTLAADPPALAQTLQGPSDPTPAAAGPSTDRPSAGAPERGDSLDGRDVEEFMDGFVARQLEEQNIPGATVSVVKDGEVIFAEGYGQADVEREEPVVAEETLFRIASTSKLFTATAAMQLVEEGKVDLDEDVNTYLDDVEIPDTYPGRPVTLRHLLTHTAGFEESFTGSLARTAGEVEPLGEYLSGNTPARVRPPGEVASYSNFGMSLAGHVVEEVSGQPYDRYLEENVFGPLGMEGTTAAQPPEPALRERLATGYEAGGDGPVAGPFEYINEAPAGSASTTSPDMARFMLAHLGDGSHEGARVLEAATAREMRGEQFANAPGLEDGMGLGFYEQTINGERTVQHAGNLIRFHGLLTLLPDRDVGVFVAYNSYGTSNGLAEYELTDAFMDRYYPGEKPATLEPSTADANAERFAGSYRITRSNTTGFEKANTLLTGARVTANPDGSLTTRGGILTRDFAETEGRWIQTGPATFRAEGGDERIAFREVGGATYLSSDADPTSAYAKLPFYAAPRLHLGLLAGAAAVLLLSALAWALAWAVGGAVSWWRGRRGRKLHGKPAGRREINRPARRARLLAGAVAGLVPLFAVGMAYALSNTDTVLGFGASPLMVGVLTVPVVISALAAGVLVHAALAWARGYWGLLGRLHYSLVSVSALVLVALLAYYNLIGYQF